MTQRTIFVPLALKLEHAEALMAAAHVVLQSGMVAKEKGDPMFTDMRAAYDALSDARDRELMKDRLTNGGSLGEIMLQRIQRDLAADDV